jgi:hypothetical protein
MSTICLAAQRSYQTGEAVWFSYRLPSLSRILFKTLACLLCLCAMAAAGVYAHIYWNLRHPAPAPKTVSTAKPDTQISDMHYVYVSKPFPQPKPAQPVPQDPLPPLQDTPINDDNADWQRAPDGDLSSEPLPGHEQPQPEEQTASLKERFMQALQEQQQDYAQGVVPDDPADENPPAVEGDDSVINQTSAFKSERVSAAGIKKSPQAITHGDLRFENQ